MDEYKLIGKDEVKRMLGTSSDQTAYKVIRQLNRELEAQGIKTVQGKVDCLCQAGNEQKGMLTPSVNVLVRNYVSIPSVDFYATAYTSAL